MTSTHLTHFGFLTFSHILVRRLEYTDYFIFSYEIRQVLYLSLESTSTD